MTFGMTTTAGPGAQVEDAAAYCLELAVTWLRWDGRPLTSEDGDRIYTPHKVIRRIADHLIDHIAEVEALLAGVDTQPDAWRASEITLESDWARFTEPDLSEARERITRLARTFALRLRALDPAEWDAPRAPNWTVREIADHLTGITWYANQLGRL